MRKEKVDPLVLAHLGMLGQSERANCQEARTWTNDVDYVFLGFALNNVDYRFLIVKSGVPNMCVGVIMESEMLHSLRMNFQCKEIHLALLVKNL